MTEAPPLGGLEDAAWAAVNTPLTPDELRAFCRDVEGLFRINPLYEFRQWTAEPDGRIHWRARNISQQPAFEVDVWLRVVEVPEGIRVVYESGLKDSTLFRVEAAETGSRLTIIDRYERLEPGEREARLGEVDKSLVAWAHDIQAYLVRWRRWSGIAPWRWYMRRVWRPMKPSARRIVFMLWWIAAAELAVILLVAGIYWAEYT